MDGKTQNPKQTQNENENEKRFKIPNLKFEFENLNKTSFTDTK